MGCTSTTSKQILLLINFILALLGLVLIGVGIFILVSASETSVNHGETLAGGLVITIGIISVVFAIFGCLAAIHESKKRLIAYVIALVALILLQLIMASMATTGSRDGLAGSVHEGFAQLWEYELEEPGSLAFYEDWLHCCGVNNTADYHNIGHAIPKSCCIAHNCSSIENIYSIGCEERFESYLYDKFLTFTIVIYLIMIIEIIAAVFAWLLLNSIRNEGRRTRMEWM